MLNLLIFQFRCGQLMSQPNNGCDFHLGNQLLKISILITLCFSSPKKNFLKVKPICHIAFPSKSILPHQQSAHMYQLMGCKDLVENYERGAIFWTASKGQLISEWLFGVFNFPKHQYKNLMNFCPRIINVVQSKR